MVTPNFNWTELSAAQFQKEVSINDVFNKIEDAFSEIEALTIDDSNARTLTDVEFRENFFYDFTDDGTPPTAQITLTCPAITRGTFMVVNGTGQDMHVEISGQSVTAPIVATGEASLLASDGSDIREAGGGGGGAADFLTLTDTPSTFSGQGGKVATVNSGENALEFTEAGVGGVQPVAVTPAFKGALLSLDGQFNTGAAAEPLPWGAADYDTSFQPATGGAQRLWLGVNRTFVDGDVTTGTDVIADTAHGFTTGEGPVRLTSSGTLPAGLALATDYWIIAVDANNIALAVSRASALDDVRVDITAAAGGGTHTVNTETKLVVPAGVTRVRLNAGIDTEAAAISEMMQLGIVKNFGVLTDGNSLMGIAQGASAGSRGLLAATAVIEVTEGDVFEALVDIGGGTQDIDDTPPTFFAMEIVETTEVQPLPTAFLAVQPTFEGALLKRSSTFVTSGSSEPVPMQTADYDTTFQPDDTGGTQRFWMDVNRTFVDGDVTTGTDVIADTAHGFTTGEGPVLLTSSGTLPAGLSLATDYWVIAVDANSIAFATNRANALADTRVDITAAAGGGTHTVNTETKLVVPAGVTHVKLHAGIDTESTSDATGHSVFVEKNGAGTVTFPGVGVSANLTGAAVGGSRGLSVTTPVLEVVEGDHFEMGVFAANDLDANPGTFFAMEVVDTSKPFSFPGVTVSPPHRGVLVTNSTNTVNISGGVVLGWDTESFDTDNFHDNVTNNERFTIPAGVTKVKLLAQVALTDFSVNSETFLNFRINGGNPSPTIQGSYKDDSSGGFTSRVYQLESYVMDVVEGDYLEVRANNSSTTNDDVQATATWFSLEVIETTDAAMPPEPVEHFAVGVPTVSITIFAKVAARRFSMFDDLLNSQAEAQTAPSGGAVDYDVQRNNVSIGTISFADGVATATFTTAGSVEEVFEVGDVLEIITPANLQTMANVAFNLWAFRS